MQIKHALSNHPANVTHYSQCSDMNGFLLFTHALLRLTLTDKLIKIIIFILIYFHRSRLIALADSSYDCAITVKYNSYNPIERFFF